MVSQRLARLRSAAASILGRQGGPKAHRIAARWVRKPNVGAGERLCLFVMLSHTGQLLPHSVDHAARWKEAGYRIVVVLVADTLDTAIDIAPLAFADGILQRPNIGYDFGAWAATIRNLEPEVREAEMLALANDSILGPSAAFAAMLRRAEASSADLIGLTASDELRRHLQSFVLFFPRRVLQTRAFWRFWGGVRSGDRNWVIDRYETGLSAAFEARGLSAEHLFDVGPLGFGNPTLCHWRTLLDLGFPFIKVQLLRDNPVGVSLADWREVAARAGFDLAALDRQVAALKARGTHEWQV